MDNYLKSICLTVGVFFMGSAAWITLERFEKVPAMCVIDQHTYDSFAKQK